MVLGGGCVLPIKDDIKLQVVSSGLSVPCGFHMLLESTLSINVQGRYCDPYFMS